MEPTKITGYASVNGLNMYYEIYGEGNVPLVLIHGGGSTIRSSFGNLLPLLADYGKIIAMDLQAHGRTSDRDAPESFEQDADDVAALLKHLQITKANILGFSNGGTTALQLAIRYPQLVNQLIAVSAVWKRNGLIPGFFEGMQGATLDHMPALLKEAYLEVAPDKSGLQVMFEKDRQRMLGFKDGSNEALQGIAVPVLLIVAEKDVVTVEHSREMRDLIPEASLTVLPGSHGACIGELCAVDRRNKTLEVTALIIKEFLSERRLIRNRIHDIMDLEYGSNEPWCKLMQLQDFDEPFLAAPPDKDKDELYWRETNILMLHGYIENPHNPIYRDHVMRYFLETVFTDFTPESMCMRSLAEDEWQVVSRKDAEHRLDHIISCSLERLKKYSRSYPEDREKFTSLKNQFLSLFSDDVVFLQNTEAPDSPALVAMDRNTLGVYFQED